MNIDEVLHNYVVFHLHMTSANYRDRPMRKSRAGGFEALFHLYLIKTHLLRCQNKTKHI